GLPIGLDNGNGTLKLTTDRVEVQDFTGNISGGTLAATGRIVYRPDVQFNLVLSGKGIRTLFPDGVREGLNTNLTLTGSLQSALLRGQLNLTELSFSPTFDFSDLSAFAGGMPAPTAAP